MRTLIVAVTCLALGAALNAPGTGADISDWATEKDAVKKELQSLFRISNRDDLEEFAVLKEWRNRQLTQKNAEILSESNRQGYEILELRSNLRKCEKRNVREPAE